MKSKKHFTIAVSGLNAIDNPGPGVGVIRSLRADPEFSFRIIGFSYETMEPGAYMHDLVDITYQIPYPSAGSEPLLARLLTIHELEKIDFIIPNFDAELRNYIRIAPILKKHGIATFLPDMEMLTNLDKMHLHEFGAKHDILVPKTKLISSMEEIKDLEDEFDFPVFVKGKYYEAYKAFSSDQVKTYFSLLNGKWGPPVIIQEHVEGTEIDVAGLGDGKGRLMGAVPMRKLYITDRGKGWSGVVLPDESLVEYAKKFVAASRWRGGFELEFIRTKEDKLMMLEVNPRFPAWIYTTAAVGQNLPVAIVKLGMGLPVAPFESYEPGKMFVRYAWELITDISEFQKFSTQGVLTKN
jgi:carbamoyl-phosphate synthase large subunit